MMTGKRHFMCEDDDFTIKSEDKDELMEHARMHVKEKHGMEPSDEELESEIKEE